MFKKVSVYLIIITVIFMLSGCGKESKGQEVISRSEKAINQLINDDITIKEFADKMKNINNYCEAYVEKEDSKTSLCTSIYLYYYEASMSSVSDDGIDYEYWDEALEDLKDYRKTVK